MPNCRSTPDRTSSASARYAVAPFDERNGRLVIASLPKCSENRLGRAAQRGAGQVRGAQPEGIDVYFENVGGEHLNAALANMRLNGRIAVCGMIAQYNDTALPPGPPNIIAVIPLRLTIKGFIVTDHTDLMSDFIRDMAAWTKAGKMKWRETIADGIEKAPEAFIGLFKGENFGKMLVRLARE